jgi:hypothetical protein
MIKGSGKLRMALFMDKPWLSGWAHVISDKPGADGGAELRLFGARIGIMRPVHRAHSYAEHLDVRGDEIRRAAEAGVQVVRRRKLAIILRDKRRAGKR